jgi:hypothetical protein
MLQSTLQKEAKGDNEIMFYGTMQQQVSDH